LIVSVQPTSPLIETTDIDSAIDKLIETGCGPVVSACEIVHGHQYCGMKIEGDHLVLLNPDGFRCLPKQDLPQFYLLNGGCYVRKRKLSENWSRRDLALSEDFQATLMDVKINIYVYVFGSHNR